MKKSVKIALILAAVLILLGMTLCISVAASIGRNWDRLSTFVSGEDYRREEYVIPAEQLSGLLVEEGANDIQITGEEGSEVRVSYVESDTESYEIELSPQGQLCIRKQGSPRHFAFQLFGSRENTELQIRIPQELAGDLKLQTASGDASISGLNISGAAQIETASGDLRLYKCSIRESMDFSSASGDMRLQEVESGGELRLRTSSGNIYLADSKGTAGNWQLSSSSGDLQPKNLKIQGDLQLESVSGEQELEHLQIEGDLQTESTSGEIELQGVSAQDMEFRSTSGDIEGTLLGDPADYSFNSRSTSGSIRLPSGNGSRYSLNVSTTSGDVELQMQDW